MHRQSARSGACSSPCRRTVRSRPAMSHGRFPVSRSISIRETGEVPDDGATLVAADDRAMLAHYGIEDAAPARLWRTVTPAALSRTCRAPAHRSSSDARRGEGRCRASARAGGSGMGRAAGIASCGHRCTRAGDPRAARAVRSQRDSVRKPSQPAHASPRSASGMSRSPSRDPVEGPLLIGDGRYLGLGLMRPVRRTEGVFAFAIADGLDGTGRTAGLARALRRAVMARVQETMGERATLPAFFTGHATDGAPARSGSHRTPRLCVRRPAKAIDDCCATCSRATRSFANRAQMRFDVLERALGDFCELRAGPAGKLSLVLLPCRRCRTIPYSPDRHTWESLTPYRVTRHAKMNDAAAALEADLLAECRRGGLPRPEIEVTKTFGEIGRWDCSAARSSGFATRWQGRYFLAVIAISGAGCSWRPV